MKLQTFLSRQELLVTAATLAAHSTAQGNAFRQKDVLFLFDLFSNWCKSGMWEEEQKYQNTQLARFLDQLAKDGYAKRNKDKSRPSYRLTRNGLVELLFRITNRERANPEQFLFAHYFIKNYKDRLITLVQEEGKLFPAALKLELYALLDDGALLASEIARVMKVKLRMQERVSEATETSKLAEVCLRKGMNIEETIRMIEKEHPYELNNQRPLSDLIGSIPPEQRIWEINKGATYRSKQIWSPMLVVIGSYERALRELEKSR